MNEELLRRKSDPKYDEDLVNLRYLKDIEKNIEKKLNTLLETIFPIGSIYSSTSNINPSDLFGGTWEERSFMLFNITNKNGSQTTYCLNNTGGTITDSNNVQIYNDESSASRWRLKISKNGNNGTPTFNMKIWVRTA